MQPTDFTIKFTVSYAVSGEKIGFKTFYECFPNADPL